MRRLLPARYEALQISYPIGSGGNAMMPGMGKKNGKGRKSQDTRFLERCRIRRILQL